jgi:hypothetical protein
VLTVEKRRLTQRSTSLPICAVPFTENGLYRRVWRRMSLDFGQRGRLQLFRLVSRKGKRLRWFVGGMSPRRFGRHDHAWLAGLVQARVRPGPHQKARSRRASACYCALAILPVMGLVAKSGPNASALSTPRSWASLERARLTRLFTVPTAHLVISAVSS